MADLLIKITLVVMLVTGSGMAASQVFCRDEDLPALTVSEIIESINRGFDDDEEKEKGSRR